jgi:N-acetylglutamate synthase-like GNAT family acetyltransferase
MNSKIGILPFQTEHQNDIDAMMEGIALEFKEPIFAEKSKKIIDVFSMPNNKFWIAINGNKVVGTIGMVKLTNKNIVLKSMFVDKMYRGQGISNLLLDTLLNWTIQCKYKQVYLGTMTQFLSGQRFYEKNGFVKCNKNELPTDFTINTLDTIFYTKQLIKKQRIKTPAGNMGLPKLGHKC